MRWCFDFACVTCATLRGLTKKAAPPEVEKSLIARALSSQCTTLHDIALIMSRFKKMKGHQATAKQTKTRTLSWLKCITLQRFCRRLLNCFFLKMRRKVVSSLGRMRLKGIAKKNIQRPTERGVNLIQASRLLAVAPQSKG